MATPETQKKVNTLRLSFPKSYFLRKSVDFADISQEDFEERELVK